MKVVTYTLSPDAPQAWSYFQVESGTSEPTGI